MLPSKGLFRENPCPFFELGECERPYCHYKHKKPEASCELFSEYIATLDKVIDNLPVQKDEAVSATSSQSLEDEKHAVETLESDIVNNLKIPNTEVYKPSKPGSARSSVDDNTNRINEKPQAGSSGNKYKDMTAGIVYTPSVINKKDSPSSSTVSAETAKQFEQKTNEEIDPVEISSDGNTAPVQPKEETQANHSDEGEKRVSNGTGKQKKLTKEQLRNIDEIVMLLKKVPERIDFVASFLKTLVQTEDKKSSSFSSSSHRSKSHSSKSHKSSHSSHDSDKKQEHKSSRHRKSSRSDKKESSSSRSDKRKRSSDSKHKDNPTKKVALQESSKRVQEEQDDAIDSDTCDDIAMAFEDSETNAEAVGGKRLSVEEELEHIHEKKVPAAGATNKRRVAHDTPYIADHTMLRAKVSKSAPIMRPAERVAASSSTPQVSLPAEPRTSSLMGVNPNKPRIAAVSNFQRLLAEKSNLANIASRSNTNLPTIAKTVSAGGKRLEHRTETKDFLCPTVKEGSKSIAIGIRNRTLQRLYGAFSYLPSKNEASEMALQVERKIFIDSKDNAKKYHMASVNAFMKAKRGYSNDKPSGPSELEFYELVQPFLMTEEQLAENGFPVEVEEGVASCFLSPEFRYNKKFKHIKDAFEKGERYCIRCSKIYNVDSETWEQTPIPDVCVFHSDNNKKRVLGEVTHKCCGAPGPGCTSESLHITDLNDYEQLPGCVKSQSKSPSERYHKVLALDCEMVYTRLGVELAYIVVVDSSCKVVYESYCKPSREVESYNTTYSGITEEKLRRVTKTLSTVQKELLELISDETVLVGHSLDSDFRALHLIHGVVADTSFIFRVESPDGTFYKRRLKELAQSCLGKIIQESEYGHDAQEDADTAMALLRHRVLSM